MREELIQLFKNGNRQAGDDYYTTNIKLVYSIANKYTKLHIDKEEVMAIVNQAFAHAMKNVDLNKAKFSTYFIAVANGMLMRHCRDYAHTIRVSRKDYAHTIRVSRKDYAITKKTISCDSLDKVIFTDDTTDICIKDTLDTEDDSTSIFVNEALDQLSPVDRKVFKLKLICGLSQAEIGRQLGTSQVSISRSITRSKKQLRIILKEVC